MTVRRDARPDLSPALGKLLYPRSIVILGASDNPAKLGGRPVDYLKRFDFPGRILPVNPGREYVQGLPAFREVEEIPGEIDLAFIMLPAGQAADAVRVCGRRGIRAAIVGASGFAETGPEGAALQEELRVAAAEAGVRILGPNCLGMISLASRAVPTFSSALDEDIELTEGPVAFVSQSGAYGSFVFSEAQHLGIGVSYYLNTGNEADLSAAEMLQALAEDPGVGVLLAYVEGVSDGRRLLETARRARELDKPLILVKAGRSAAGARAAASHTAALATDDAVFDGVARQHGIIRVDGAEAMLDAAQMFATGRRARGRRLTTLSVSGGAGALMADAASASGLEVTAWDKTWQEKMAAAIPRYGSPRNPVDLTGSLISDPGILRRALEVATGHPDTDMIAVMLGTADSCADDLIDAIAAASERSDRPVVVTWTGGSGRPRKRLAELGIPCYPDLGRAAAVLGALASFSLRPAASEPARPAGVPGPGRVPLAASAGGRRQLDEYQSTRLIAAYGIPCAESRTAATVAGAAAAFGDLGGGPVAVKILSDQVGHKSDIGGVRLSLRTPGEVEEAAADLLETGGAGLLETGGAGLLVQAMARGDVELIAGIKRDDSFGPVVVAGLGGVFAEVLGDSQAAAAPVDHGTARRMLTSLRGAGIFSAARGKPAVDLDAAADVIVRLSWLAADRPDIAELDVNPLLLDRETGTVTAADCLAVLDGDGDAT
ncbi:MAG: acetate--CoA ligase family protein [Streptosporangiales bacterium]|nr:acetate--CoA ligase family protein [Streptosporangiales bacterium]